MSHGNMSSPGRARRRRTAGNSGWVVIATDSAPADPQVVGRSRVVVPDPNGSREQRRAAKRTRRATDPGCGHQ